MKTHKNKLMAIMLSSAVSAMLLSTLFPAAALGANADLAAANSFFNTDYTEESYLSREEFCAMLAETFLAGYSAEVELPFEDAEQIKPENVFYISALKDSGVLSGAEEAGKLYMKPEDEITKQEAYALIGKVILGEDMLSSSAALPYDDAEDVLAYARPAAAWLAENGFLPDYKNNLLKPSENLSAAEFAEVIVKLMDYKNEGLGRLASIAGTGAQGYENGSAKGASFTLPYGIAADGRGNLVIADTYNNKLRLIGRTGTENIAGKTEETGEDGFAEGQSKDAALASALLNRPYGVVINSNGDFIFSDSAGNRIRVIDSKEADTLAGSRAGFKDGALSEALFNFPTAIAIDGNDSVYVADTLNHCIRKIEAGRVSVLAGIPGEEGFNNGAADKALFLEPTGIAVTPDGKTVYVADTGNQMIRKIENGQVSTAAGTAAEKDEDGYSIGGFRDGAVSMAMFNQPSGLALAGDRLLVADSGNNRIRGIYNGEVFTVAGNGEAGDRDGASLFAELNHPRGLCYSNGVIYIADTTNNKIRQLPYAE